MQPIQPYYKRSPKLQIYVNKDFYTHYIINDDLIELGNEKGAGVSVRLPSNKVMPRRTSSRDLLRGGVIRRQSSKDLRSAVLMKRQSSRDMVNGGPKNVTKDPRICLIAGQTAPALTWVLSHLWMTMPTPPTKKHRHRHGLWSQV